MHTGYMASKTTVTTKTITASKLVTACGTGATVTGISGASSALANPLIHITCLKNSVSYTVVATVSASTGSATKIFALGGTTGCNRQSIGYNPAATGSKATAVYYATNYTSSDNCMTGTAYNSRKVHLLSAAGKVVTKTISGNPWGSSTSDEPSYLYFAPGKSSGTFIGSATVGGYSTPPTGARLFTVASSGTMTVKSGTVSYSASPLSDWTYPSLFPVKEVSSSKWTFRVGSAATPGTYDIALATINPSTRAVAVGETLTVDGYGSYNYSAIINTIAWAADGKMRHYVLTSGTGVKITTWTSPSS